MWRKSIWLAIPFLTLSAVVALLVLAKISSPHASDSQLSTNFHDHEAAFNQLVEMSRNDSAVITVGTSFVCLKNNEDWPPYIYLHDNEQWPLSETRLKFSRRRWDEYRTLLRNLNLNIGIEQKPDVPGAIFFTASSDYSEIDDSETAVTEKGYVYSSAEINSSLTGSLDGIQINRPAIFYRKLTRNWYLYYEWSVAKPE